MAGRLVLVVGPSGAGKDALLRGARDALADDHRFVFPRRAVTRPAIAAIEDHESVSVAEFTRREAEGAYALSWRAHGLCYGLPASLSAALDAGRTIVVNASRAVIATARAEFPGAAVVLVEAPAHIRAARLAGRGRESRTEIAERLKREPTLPMEGALVIDNSGSFEQGLLQFTSALQRLAAD